MIKGNLKTESAPAQNSIGRTAESVAAQPSKATNEAYNAATIQDSTGNEASYVGINNTLSSVPNNGGLRIGSAIERAGNSFPSASGAKGVTHAIGTTKTAKG